MTQAVSRLPRRDSRWYGIVDVVRDRHSVRHGSVCGDSHSRMDSDILLVADHLFLAVFSRRGRRSAHQDGYGDTCVSTLVCRGHALRRLLRCPSCGDRLLACTSPVAVRGRSIW